MTAPEPTLRDALAELANSAQKHIDLDAIDDYQRGWRQAHRKFKRDLEEHLAAHPAPEPTAITMQSDVHNSEPSEPCSKPGSNLENAGSTEPSEVRLADDEGAVCDCGHRVKWHHDERGCGYLGFNKEQRCDCLLGSDAAVERILAARLADLTAERDEALASAARWQDRCLDAQRERDALRGGGTTASHYRDEVRRWREWAEKAEAERDALRAQVEAVAALADEWACDDPGCEREGGDFIRAALSDPAQMLAARDAEVKADAWDEGFKQGGPMHDVNYDDPDAHTRNPYRARARGQRDGSN